MFGKPLKRNRSELVEAFDLGHLPDERIISIAQREMAADQRLAEAKEVANQRPSSPSPTSAAQGDDPPANQPGAAPSPDADGLKLDRSPRQARPGPGGEARNMRRGSRRQPSGRKTRVESANAHPAQMRPGNFHRGASAQNANPQTGMSWLPASIVHNS